MATHCLHIGINNYPGSINDLRGCVPDERNNVRLFNAAQRRRGTRRDAIDNCRYFGQCDTQVLLLDREATRANVLRQMRKLLNRLAADDWGIITFSGHGTYARDKSGDETDGFDEALVCYDNVVVDDELATLLEGRPEQSSRVLFATDACHSGTNSRSLGPRLSLVPDPNLRFRFLPPARLPAAARDVHVAGQIRAPRKAFNVIHLAACLDQQFAADAQFSGSHGDGGFEGAFNHFKNEALCSLPAGACFGDWAQALAKLLPNDEYDQVPVVNAYARCLEWKLPAMK